MRLLLFTMLFTLPFVAHAASFTFEANQIEVGESTQVTLYVSSEESVYTVKAIVALDQKTLAIESIVIGNGWIPLSQPGYDSVSEGRFIKTAGFPGGLTAKTPFLTFTVTRLTKGVGVISVESSSKAYDKDSRNVATVFDTKTFGTFSLPSLPAAFSISEDVSEPEIIVEEEEKEPIVEVVDKIKLPAAVITIDGALPVVPLAILFLVLLGGFGIYLGIRKRREHR